MKTARGWRPCVSSCEIRSRDATIQRHSTTQGPQCGLATSAAVRGRISGWVPADAVSDDLWALDIHGSQGGMRRAPRFERAAEQLGRLCRPASRALPKKQYSLASAIRTPKAWAPRLRILISERLSFLDFAGDAAEERTTSALCASLRATHVLGSLSRSRSRVLWSPATIRVPLCASRRDALGDVQFVCTRGRRCFPISRDL